MKGRFYVAVATTALCTYGLKFRGAHDAEAVSLLQQGGGPVKSIFRNFRSTTGNALSEVLGQLTGDMCTGAFLVYGHSGDDDYPFVPACYGRGMDNELTCFAGSTVVNTPHGVRRLDSLAVGDLVQSDIARFERVEAFLHFEKSKLANFVTVEAVEVDTQCSRETSLEYTNSRQTSAVASKIAVTRSHLLFACETDDASDAADCVTGVPTPARLLTTNHVLLVESASGKQYTPHKIARVSTIARQENIVAPLTRTGTLIANGILSSQFSEVPLLSPSTVHTLGVQAAKIIPVLSHLLPFMRRVSQTLLIIAKMTYIAK